jgi:hypothetical protein
MFSLDNSFVQVFPFQNAPSKRNSFVSVLAQPSTLLNAIQDSLPFQIKNADGVENLARLFWKLYAPGTTPTSLELANLQAHLVGSPTIRVRLKRKVGGVFVSSQVIGKVNASPAYMTFSVPFVDNVVGSIIDTRGELCYLEFAFLMPESVIWEGAQDYQGQWVYLLQTDLFFIKNTLIYSNNDYFAQVFYQESTNAYGFVYAFVYESEVYDFSNTFRLPVRLQKPQIRTSIERYKDSGGVYKTVSATADYEFEFDTEWCDVHFHKCLAVALLHNRLKINGVDYVLSTDYNIEYQSLPMPVLGKAKSKLIASPFDNQSPNFV